MSDTEMHPVVELLLARMKSHPEDFVFEHGSAYPHGGRISVICEMYNDTLVYASEAEIALLKEANNKLHLDAVHHRLMDELLNGEDHRRKQEEEAQYERAILAAQTKLGQASNYANANQALHQYQNAMLGSNNQMGGLLGSGVQNAYSSQPPLPTASELQTTLSTSSINSIKKALGM